MSSILVKDEHFIHLCQPGKGKSCGACCGLYNYADSSRESLVGRLRRRTRLFREIVHGPEGLQAFARLMGTTESQEKRYEVIYCCEYVGFLDDKEHTVGCLLHPLQNGGTDFRDVSFYGKELCDGHFCPSYHYISDEEKRALLAIIDDWYLYGLCVTDIDLVKEYFRLISEKLGEMPSAATFENGELKESALRFFALKTSWQFRSRETNRFGKYYFDGSQYMIQHIDYEWLGVPRSPFDKIFLSLTSQFDTRSELERAEALITGHITDFVARYHRVR